MLTNKEYLQFKKYRTEKSPETAKTARGEGAAKRNPS